MSATDWIVDVLNGRQPLAPLSRLRSASVSSSSSSSSGLAPASGSAELGPIPVTLSPSDPASASGSAELGPIPVTVSTSDPQPQLLQLCKRLEAAERKLAQLKPWSPATICCTHTPPAAPKRARALPPPATPRKKRKADRKDVIVID
jgi:hypothetical protein